MGYHYKYKQYVYRHMYPKKSSALFTYHKYPDGKGGFLDDGICELCGTKGRTVLIDRSCNFGITAFERQEEVEVQL